MSRSGRSSLPPALEAQRLLARARQFRRVAVPLPDMEAYELNWPKWFLVGHAVELAIKAYVISREDNTPAPEMPKPANHDLVAQYNYAVLYGLPRDPLVTKELPHLSELHQVHYARYPQAEAMPAALIAYFDDMVDKLIMDISQAMVRRSAKEPRRSSRASSDRGEIASTHADHGRK